MRQHEQILLGGAGLFDASDSILRADWRVYVERLNLKDNYPGVLGVGYSEIIQPASLKAHLAAIRATGFPEYTVRPPGERPLYSSIIYLEPFSGRNLAVFGYDMLSEDTRAKAMRIAGESGKTSITGKVKLVQDTSGKGQAGFLMFVPVYHKNQPITTPEERWRALRGIVYSPFRMADLMDGILRSYLLKLDFAIFDGEDESSEARMYQSINEQAFEARAILAKMSTTRTIYAYGHTWTVRLYSHPDLEADLRSPISVAVLVLGTGISMLLFALMTSLIFRRVHAEKMAEAMTQQIRENESHLLEINQRFDLAADSANIGVWDYDIAAGKLVWDARMCQLYGMDSSEFDGAYATWSSRLHPEDRAQFDAELRAALAEARSFDTTFRIIWNDGKVHYIKASALVRLGQNGLPVRMIGINYDISERKRIEMELDSRIHDLGKRIKEQSCLYQIASLARESALPLEKFIENAVNLLPPALQYSDHACARIVYSGKEYVSSNYAASKWKMAAPIVVGENEQGLLEVAYLKEMPQEEHGPFLHEEWGLIEVIASQIGQGIDMRLADSALKESGQFVQAIVENILDGVITIDEHGVIKFFNRSAERIFGYSAAETIGNNVKMLMPEPYHSEHDGYLNNYITTGKKKVIGIGRQVTGRRKNGETFPMDLAVTEMRLEGSRMFAGVVRDISDRKKMEVELAKRVHDLGERIKEQRCLYHLASMSRDATILLEDFFAKAVSLLPPAMQYPEYACAKITCRNREYSSCNYASSEWKLMAPIISGGIEIGMVEICYHRDMSLEQEGPFLLEEQELIEAFASQIGQTIDMRLAEEELRKQSRAVEQSPVSVMITDAAGKIEYVNAKFSEVTGYSAQEVIGENPRIIQSGQTPEDVYRSMWQALQSGKQWQGKLQNRKKNGELFWEEMYISAIRDSEGRTTNYVAVKEDITERIQIERMKSEFISTVSHELRTPLTSIRGSLALVAAGVTGELPAAAKPMVEIAHKNSERLILLVNDILDMEKIEAGRVELTIAPIKLMPLIEQALESNQAYAAQFKVAYELENGMPGVVIQVDSNRLLQVLANLLSNAAKFSHAGGKVKVAVERHDECIRISIKDNGSGIPDEFRSRIFQKFSQADSSNTRKKGGTGLGLAITKAIVEQMGGSIGFESQPDVETTFYVEFPECKEQ